MSIVNKEEFEKELKNKLLLKSDKRFTEEQVLLRAFRFVDMENSGYCDPDLFLKAMIKLGINSVHDENVNEYFALYDKEKKGVINYADFVTEIFNPLELKKRRIMQGDFDPQASSGKKEKNVKGKETPVKAQVQKPTNQSNEKLESKKVQSLEANKRIINKIQDSVRARGNNSIFDMEKRVRQLDPDNTGNLDIDGFGRICNEFLNLTPNETKEIFMSFDPSHSGKLNYDDFLQVVHGKLNENRGALIDDLFDYLDGNRLGYVDINEVCSKFNPKNLPEVLCGKKYENTAKSEFTEPIWVHHEYFDEESTKLSYDEFLDFFECLSFYYLKDDEFEAYIRNGFGLREPNKVENLLEADKKAGNPDEDLKEKSNEILILLSYIRKLLAEQGAKPIIQILKNFREIDRDNSQGVDFDEFLVALKDVQNRSQGLLKPKDFHALFNIYDIKQKNIINYNQFYDDLVLRNLMQSSRVKLINDIFVHLDFECKGAIDINQLKKIYTDPKKGDPNPVPDLLEAFGLFHLLNRGSRNPLVRDQDFLDFYSIINFLIPEGKTDSLYEDFVSTTWHLYDKSFDERRNLKKQMLDTLGKQKNRAMRDKNVGSKKAPYGVDPDKINYDLSDPVPTIRYNFNKIADVLAHFRNEMLLRGTRGIMQLRRTFMLGDENGTQTLDFGEFKKTFRNFRIEFDDIEMENLFRYFDVNDSGEIDYKEFINGILGDLNENRKKVLKNVFEKLDSEKKGYITVGQLRENYNPSMNPDCRLGQKTEQEVLAEFLDDLEYHFNLLNEKNGETVEVDDIKVDLLDFMDFYKTISLTIEDDKRFEIALYGEWGVGVQPYQRGWRGYEN